MLTPTNEDDLAEAIRGAEGPLAIQGGGTRGAQIEGTTLTTSAISGITTYEPGALTLVAKAGTPVTEIEATLAAENQILAFEPMDSRALLGTSGTPTIGGIVATNTSGPRRVQAGACRDYLLGVRFVDGHGDIIQNGGRVMKNVTGYDLARLQCGARGTLGVLTEVGFKVLPRPEFTATLKFENLDRTATANLFTSAMKTPYEVTGAARTPGVKGTALLRLEGFEESVKYRAKALLDHLGNSAEIETNPDKNSEIWTAIRDVTPFANHDGDIWSLSIKPTDFGKLTEPLDNMLVDWACGRVWLKTPKNTNLRAMLKDISGHATLIRGEGQHIHPEVEPLAKLAGALRQKYDPRGILNPGLMG